jgi:glycosyltransferase involved in cell wall biosynthesis
VLQNTEKNQPTNNLDKHNPNVAILLCTMQGEHFLREQLDSIANQTYPNWTVWVSDDGSTDGTQNIFKEYLGKFGKDKFQIEKGPAQGYIKNFLSLVCNKQIEASYYAYSDQDDIWLPDKLRRALAWIENVPSSVPALYCARTCNVDEKNNVLGLSPLFARQPTFANALVQSIAGGNTMLFNQAACNLLRQAGPAVKVASHDWWTYLVVSGCGGQVYYDPEPTLRYRIHGSNQIGSNNTWEARIARARLLYEGRFSEWTDMNIASLRRLSDHLAPDAARLLNEFSQLRSQNLLARLIRIKRSGIYRQTTFGNLGLMAAVLLKKI